MTTALTFYQRLKKLSEQQNHRNLYCLQGSQNWCFQQTLSIIEQYQGQYKWCGQAPSSITETQYASLLGHDTELLILNMQTHFDANMFAAAEGSVLGGSVIIVLLPNEIPASDNFFSYILQQVNAQSFPILKEGSQAPLNDLPIPTSNYNEHQFIHSLNLTDQAQAIQEIIKTVTGHRRRPLVLTANRGRGKSAALGIAAAQLINNGAKKILVCAPNKQATNTLYKHAQLTLMNKEDIQSLSFISPDALFIDKPACELLLVDEAAAIPLKLLNAFAAHYSRVVFASTQFGYEGSGRGFALRFQKQLQTIAPQWRHFTLKQPIRWADNDPIEAFTLTSLCLKETNSPEFPDDITSTTIKIINKKDLLHYPELLNKIFSLLINAHYQTKPSDLAVLLNDTNTTIIAMQTQEAIMAVALINNEGGFNEEMSTAIYQGKRRPAGDLIAQSFTFHSGFIEAATHRYARVQRIAVQPSLQNSQYGSQLLSWVINWAKQEQYDHVSASFSADEQLLSFWLKNKLEVLRIGTRKDKSSGQHSFMVNFSLTDKGKHLHQQIKNHFVQQVKVQLSRQLRYLDASLISLIWNQLTTSSASRHIADYLSAYLDGNRAYENVEYLLIELLYQYPLDHLSTKQKAVLIEKVTQNYDWHEIVKRHQFTGQKEAQLYVKGCIIALLNTDTQHITN